MIASDRLLRYLCWALVVLVVASAILTLGLALDLFAKPPDLPSSVDFVDRLLAVRAYDTQVYPVALAAGLAGVGVFLGAALLGAVVRPLAPRGPARDLMTTLFVVGGVIGVVAQLLNIAIAKSGTYDYCDCGYKAQEVISLGYAIGVAVTGQTWLAIAALTIVGLGAAVGGWLINLSPAFRWLAYLIAGLLVVSAVLLFFDYGQWSNTVSGLVAGIAVPIWLVLLARGSRKVASEA